MRQKKNVGNDLNEEKENDNPCPESTNGTIDVTTNCSLTVGQKRPIELVDSNSDNTETEIMKLKKRCIDLEQRVEILEKSCLFIPEHMAYCIQNGFPDITQSSNDNNNNNDVIMLNNDDLVMMNNDGVNAGNYAADVVKVNINPDVVKVNIDPDVVKVNINPDVVKVNINPDVNAITTLNIDNVTLNSLKQESATSTARSILRYLYPNPEMNFKLSNMDKGLVKAVIDCVQKIHAGELTTKTKIKRAMSNYFCLLHYRKKNQSFQIKKFKKETEHS